MILSFLKCFLFYSETKDFVDYKDRPKIVRKVIDATYNKLAKKEQSEWRGYNGHREYKICAILDDKFITHMINERKDKKEYWFLDIGAGLFQWGRSVMKLVENVKDKSIKFNVISIRAEKSEPEEIKQSENCTLYEFGNFKAEYIKDELEKRGLFLDNKIDLIVSTWCFRHLVDPLGTFVQTYNLLAPNGFILMDGFFSLINSDKLPKGGDHNRPMSFILSQIDADIILHPFNCGRSLNQFVIRKTNADPLYIPLQYSGLLEGVDNAQIASRTVTKFKQLSEAKGEMYTYTETNYDDIDYDKEITWFIKREDDSYMTKLGDKCFFIGNKGLMEYFVNNNLLRNDDNKKFNIFKIK